MEMPPIDLPESITSLSAIVDDPYGHDTDTCIIFDLISIAVKDVECLQMKLDLVSKGKCYIDEEDDAFILASNDYFAPAADCEEVETDDELRELYLLWNLGPDGDMKWVAKKRGIPFKRWRRERKTR